MTQPHLDIDSTATTTTITTDPSDFPARLLALSTLQIIANNTEFTSIRSISLETLTHVASRYLELLGESARASADLSSRDHSNGWDISGVLESLQGPGALSGLHNWCIDHVDRFSNQNKPRNRSKVQIINDSNNQNENEVDKLAKISRSLVEFRPPSPPQPITSISFLPLTDAEVAALDRAGESDVEDDHPSPLASTSASSEDDSDIEIGPPQPQPLPSSPLTPLSSQVVSPSHNEAPKSDGARVVLEEKPDQNHSWRSDDDIPAYVPSYFPPFPGLERRDDHTGGGSNLSKKLQPVKDSSPPDHLKNSPETLDPYFSTVPFSKSQLQEFHGEFLIPQPSSSPPNSPESVKKKRRIGGTLDAFLQTYNFMLEEKKTNKAAEEKKFLKPNLARHKMIDSQRTPAIHDTMFGGIPLSSNRPTRWSAGWIPHPPMKDGQLLPVPELRPYGHTPLPVPVTMPVPIQFPSDSLVNQPHMRIPSLIPRMFQKINHNVRADTFTLVKRMTRLAPPSDLGETGEPLPYKIQEINNNQNINSNSNNNNNNQNVNGEKNDELSRPKYLEWGFQWPSHDGRDPLPTINKDPSSSSKNDFKPQEFPGMPKTTAEKARLAKRDNPDGIFNVGSSVLGTNNVGKSSGVENESNSVNTGVMMDICKN